MNDLWRRISAQSGDERERECLPVPKVICCHSAIQRYLAPQQFLGGRPPALMVIPAFTFSNQFFSSPSVSGMPWALKKYNNNNNNNKSSIFKPPSGIDTEGKKIIIQAFVRRTLSASELNLRRRYQPSISQGCMTCEYLLNILHVRHLCLLFCI